MECVCILCVLMDWFIKFVLYFGCAVVLFAIVSGSIFGMLDIVKGIALLLKDDLTDY